MNYFKLVKYISFWKLFNVFKVLIGYILSVIFKRVYVWGSAYAITTEPTNYCNLHCLECPAGNNEMSRNKGYMDFELYKKIISEVRKYTIYQMLYFQGEPFLHPQLIDMIKYSDSHRIYTTISTNGHFLSKETNKKIIQSGLKKIIISIDGITQEVYQKYRIGGDLNRVIQGVKDLVLEKKKNKSDFPYIIIQFLVLRTNEHQTREMKKLATDLGIDKIEFKSAQVYNFEYGLIPENDKFSRYKKEGDSFTVKNRFKNYCFRIWSVMVTTWEGTVVPCCFDKNAQYSLVELKNTNSVLAWKSGIFNMFRKRILLNRKRTDICNNCTEGLKIKY